MRVSRFAWSTICAILIACLSPTRTTYGQAPAASWVPVGYISHAKAAEKYALVISVEHYENFLSVDNALNDGREISKALSAAGYTFVRFVPDPPNTDVILDRLDELLSTSRAASEPAVLTVFFAGHGYHTPFTNYLVPAKAKVSSLDTDSLPVSTIIRRISPTKFTLGIVLLDACRTVRSFDGSNTSNGLTLNRPPGFTEQKEDGVTVVSMAASANSSASSIGHMIPEDSPYSGALKQFLPMKSRSLDQLFDDVLSYVKQDTHELQIPVQTKRAGTSRFYLRPTKKEDDAQDDIWAKVMGSGPRLNCLKDYVNRYPVGRYVRDAQYLISQAPSLDATNESNCIVQESP